MSSTELRPHLHRLALGEWQAYLWADGDGATLIDTGPAGSGPQIEADLREVGLAVGDLDRIVLTHWHEDHTGSAADLAALGDLQVVAHTADAPVIRGEQAGAPPNLTDFERALKSDIALPPAPPVRVDHEVSDGDVLDFGGGAHVVGTPGHTDGSIALYLPRHRLVLTGDIAAEYEGEVIFGVFHVDRETAFASFQRVAALDVDVACFGHGRPALEDAGKRLRAVTPPPDLG